MNAPGNIQRSTHSMIFRDLISPRTRSNTIISQPCVTLPRGHLDAQPGTVRRYDRDSIRRLVRTSMRRGIRIDLKRSELLAPVFCENRKRRIDTSENDVGTRLRTVPGRHQHYVPCRCGVQDPLGKNARWRTRDSPPAHAGRQRSFGRRRGQTPRAGFPAATHSRRNQPQPLTTAPM